MSNVKLMPLAGMNTVEEDAALQVGGNAPKLYVRDAVNVNITPKGKVILRAGMDLATSTPYKNLWQSPLHKDTFARLGDQLVKVDTSTWESASLAIIGDADCSYEILNNQIIIAGSEGLFRYDGMTAKRLTIETPAQPMVIGSAGSLDAGMYGIAISWLRGTLESAVSAMASVELHDGSAMQITFPMVFDATITGIRLYLTKRNGGELGLAGVYKSDTVSVSIPLLPDLGRTSAFKYLSPMPTGKYLKYWRGRLLTAKANILRFSEPLAYHLHDERHGFVQMPQRITFVQPVEGGIWIGQVDHVAFLQGSQPNELVLIRRTAKAPIPNSAIMVDSDTVGSDISQGGGATALWLAENGYVLGTASGQIIELQAGVMKGITAKSATSVVLDRRLVTAVV